MSLRGCARLLPSTADVQDVIARIQERKKRKAQLGDRKSAAAQSRMKTIATLAAEDAVGPAKKRKKGGEKDDGFGRDDSDWAVYREVVSYAKLEVFCRD